MYNSKQVALNRHQSLLEEPRRWRHKHSESLHTLDGQLSSRPTGSQGRKDLSASWRALKALSPFRPRHQGSQTRRECLQNAYMKALASKGIHPCH